MLKKSLIAIVVLTIAFPAVASVDLLNLTFDADNPDNVAAYPGVVAGSWSYETKNTSLLQPGPTSFTADIGSGYLGTLGDWSVDQNAVAFVHLFTGSITTTESLVLDVFSIDYSELFANSRTPWSVALDIGGTRVVVDGPAPVAAGAATGSLSFDVSSVNLAPGTYSSSFIIFPTGGDPDKYLDPPSFPTPPAFAVESSIETRIKNEFGPDNPVSHDPMWFRLDNLVLTGNLVKEDDPHGAGPAASVPTLNEWGMIIFSLLMAGSAIWFIRKRGHKTC